MRVDEEDPVVAAVGDQEGAWEAGPGSVTTRFGSSLGFGFVVRRRRRACAPAVGPLDESTDERDRREHGEYDGEPRPHVGDPTRGDVSRS